MYAGWYNKKAYKYQGTLNKEHILYDKNKRQSSYISALTINGERDIKLCESYTTVSPTYTVTMATVFFDVAHRVKTGITLEGDS